MFPIAQKFVQQSLLVSDEQIIEAQRALWQQLRLIAEPGGATAFAALLSGVYKPHPGERVGVVLCGSNADLSRFSCLVSCRRRPDDDRERLAILPAFTHKYQGFPVFLPR